MTNSKFDFYEIVKICIDNPKDKAINGKVAIIRGKVRHEETHEWIYGVSIYETDGLVRRFYEKYLQATGQKANPKDFGDGMTIKVRVDPETGKGRLPRYYTSARAELGKNMLRSELLNKLLTMSLSVRYITDELNKLAWDSDEELVFLTKQHLFNILKNYQENKVNEAEVEEWANAIEGREDIGREKSYENVVDQILYKLSNPYLTEKLTKERAEILSLKLI